MRQLVKWLRDGAAGNGNGNICGPGMHAWGDQNIEPASPDLSQLFWTLLRSVLVFWKDPPPRTEASLVVPRLYDPLGGLTGWVADVWTPFWDAIKGFWKR